MYAGAGVGVGSGVGVQVAAGSGVGVRVGAGSGVGVQVGAGSGVGVGVQVAAGSGVGVSVAGAARAARAVSFLGAGSAASESRAVSALGGMVCTPPQAASRARMTAAMASADARMKAAGRWERNRGMPDAVGRGLDRRPIRTFVGGGGNALELLSERRGRLHHLRQTLHRGDSSECCSRIP